MLLDIECFFPFVEWIHHHHDEDEVDLKEVKLMKKLLRHLTTLHLHHRHLNLKDNQVSKSHLCLNQDFSLP